MGNELGNAGENVVSDFLRKHGYLIAAQNYRIRYGEIDIIAVKENCLHFVEVKTMLHIPVENLQFMIDDKKRKKIVGTAKQFLANNRQYKDMDMSFDVAVLKTNPFLPVNHEIIYLENAFEDSYDKTSK